MQKPAENRDSPFHRVVDYFLKHEKTATAKREGSDKRIEQRRKKSSTVSSAEGQSGPRNLD